MKKLILVAFLCFMASSAFAQSELPKAEIGFGYGFAVPLNSPSADMEALGIDYPNSHGWQAEAHIPFTPSFGIATTLASLFEPAVYSGGLYVFAL